MTERDLCERERKTVRGKEAVEERQTVERRRQRARQREADRGSEEVLTAVSQPASDRHEPEAGRVHGTEWAGGPGL